jgi:hypothetical protein
VAQNGSGWKVFKEVESVILERLQSIYLEDVGYFYTQNSHEEKEKSDGNNNYISYFSSLRLFGRKYMLLPLVARNVLLFLHLEPYDFDVQVNLESLGGSDADAGL